MMVTNSPSFSSRLMRRSSQIAPATWKIAQSTTATMAIHARIVKAVISRLNIGWRAEVE